MVFANLMIKWAILSENCRFSIKWKRVLINLSRVLRILRGFLRIVEGLNVINLGNLEGERLRRGEETEKCGNSSFSPIPKNPPHIFLFFFRSSTSKKNIFRFLKTYISTTRGSNGVREHGHAEWARRKTGQTMSGKRINIDKIISNIFEKHSKNSIFGLNFWILASGVKCFTRHICSRNY